MTVQKIFSNGRLAAGTVIAAAGLAFLPVLQAGYAQWDDILLTGNMAIRGLSAEQLSRILLPSGGAYQPVRDLYFSIIYSICGLEPLGYHLANWLLYMIVATLACFAARALVLRSGSGNTPGGMAAAWITALLFAVHPLHTEAVAWMQGNKDLLASAFFLGAFILWEKHTRRAGTGPILYLASLAMFLLALGSKPSAVAFPLTTLALDLLLPPGHEREQNLPARLKSMLPRYLPLLVPAALLTMYFVFVSGAISTQRLTSESILALPLILADYYRLILLPVGLSHRYVDPAFSTIADPSWWAGLIVTLGLITAAWRTRGTRPLVSFGIVWFFLCWLPQSNIIPLEIRVADRYVFLSIFGLLLALAAGSAPLLESVRSRRLATYGVILLAVLLGTLSWQRSLVWRNGVSLWSNAADQYPDNSYFQYGLAEAWMARENVDSARVCYQRAAEIAPGEARNWASLAYTYKIEGNLELAEKYYQRAIELDNTSYFAANGLGNIYSQTGRDSLAIKYYRRALELRPDRYMAAFNLASLYRKLGDNATADSLMDGIEGGKEIPRPVVLLRRGRVFIEQGKLDSAKIRFQRAVALDGNLTAAWAGLGEVYLRQDSTAKALEILRLVVSESVPGWTLLNNMGLAWERLQQPDSAITYYRMAVRAAPDSAQSAVNLAVLLNSRGDRDEAIALLKQVVEKQPGNFPALRNLGNWLTLGHQYEKAASYYAQALEANPGDAVTHYNLGRLYLQYLERPVEGLFHLKETLRLNPDMPQADMIRQAVQQLEAARGK